MVSKIIKKTPTKTIKNNRRQQRRKKTPVKNASTAASLVAASINKSFCTCHRRLIKIFSKLARIATPKKKSPRKQGYQLLHKASEETRSGVVKALFDDNGVSVPLPPLVSSKKGTVFLDLDETLVHSKPSIPPEKYDFVIKPVIDGQKVEFFVLKRPFVGELLESLSKNFEIVVFTAGIEVYASQVLDRIDQKGLISHRLYRDSCKEVDGRFVKDLSDLGRDLKRVVIVDDNPNSYSFQPENAIPIPPFVDDLGDEELKKLIQFFDQFDEIEDMRDVVKSYASQFSQGPENLEL
ncbi:OLC1v1022032C1 [Oldenlandia corymbosa var. corymbosa]|uniref:OLC1v1022032C1 n=1 Tax=Oldenlandia corymbosa var. corymbosa TaxID=529605 RepID=A0AAV1BYN5_OLDCO|nr:OLC1v1022032C1 [Oldenlandia corymbosa var. corymbosa]